MLQHYQCINRLLHASISSWLRSKLLLIRLCLNIMLMPGCFLYVTAAFSQDQNEVNRLLRIVNTQADDTIKVNALNELAWKYSKTDAPKAINFAMQAEKLSVSLAFERGRITSKVRLGQVFTYQKEYDRAEKIFLDVLKDEIKENQPYGIGRAQTILSEIYINKGDLNQALDYGLDALKTFEEISDKAAIALMANKIANIYKDMGDYDKAMEYFIKGLDIRAQLGDKKSMAFSYMDLGIFYTALKDFPKAMDYLEKSEVIFEALDDKFELAKVYKNLGVLYFEMKYYNTALKHFQRSLSLNKQLGTADKDAGIYNNIGTIYYRQSELDSALTCYRKSIAIHEKNTGGGIFVDAYINIGDLYDMEEDHEEAVIYYKAALETTEKSDKRLIQLKILNKLSDSYAKLEQHDAALKYSKEYIKLNKGIEDSYKKAITLMIDYGEQQKENITLAREKALLISKNQRKNTIIYSLIGGLALIALLSFSIIRGNRQKQQIQLMNAAIQAREKEQRRIARDLHDRLGGMLAMVALYYSAVEGNIKEAMHPDDKKKYEEANNLLDEACKEVREIAHNMVSGVLTKFGLVAALENVSYKLEQSSLIKVTLIVHGLKDRLDKHMEVHIFRIVQELISNILKYAEAKEIAIQLIRDKNGLKLLVEDDGIGFDVRHKKSPGMGFANIKYRLKLLKGTWCIDSNPGNGTTVTAYIPMLQSRESPVNLAGSARAG